MCALRWSVAVTYSCSCNMLKVCVQVVPHRVRLTHKARPLHPARCLVATMATKPSIQIEVMSDTVCPWCYIGKRRLEKAMKQFSDKADFKVHWLPFQLNPDAPLEGVNKIQSYNDKFGPARVAQMVPAMERTFASEGLQYSMGGLTGNTRNSHRLLAWAAAEHGLQKQNALAEYLFSGYFTKEQYINDRDFLLSAVEAVGLPRDAAANIIDNADSVGEKLVQQELGKYSGITGVPHFVINGRMHLGGAQPPEVIAEVFEEVLQQQAPAGSS
eukprot:GHUV01003529.1.p1 GENE.GHUV01003529.1~~GHUV01003529.1.p1  ORF type:complete len:271 (+),score=46.59 GHUV01003529.1:206-1018(+)